MKALETVVASLLVMVMIACYENFAGRFDDHDSELHWLCNSTVAA